jgi:uncharacterized protein YjcR
MKTPDVSPEQVREWCARRSWDDDVDDQSRVLLEMAADTIRALMVRTGVQSRRMEFAEAREQTLRHICYGPQKGGAS